MSIRFEDELTSTAARGFQFALSAVNSLPDHCATDMSELAARLGVDKLELITWVRADIKFARLIASKVNQ